MTRMKVERIRDLMNAHVLECEVSGYEFLIPTLTLPDPDDRHILAAAIHCGANFIVTFNLKDFPEHILEPFGIEAQHPDQFVLRHLVNTPDVVCGAARRHRESLKSPPMTAEKYLATLERQGLERTVSNLRDCAELI